ncbi:MAG: histidine phosphatase family protein [Deltaproteobacteria bacterium]|nr:MAG: histidine phosphatase family protein [Deltaproteobacteria bacterium]RLB09815.1 MAG: histidine phosphatase family protein [Deltaproteobacteria bacterium]
MEGDIMMEIYFMQHGPCLSKEQDPEQPLSPEGEELVQKVALAAAKMKLQFDVILASTKKRSLQTATFMAKSTGYPPEKIIESALLKPMAPTDETINFLKQYEQQNRILIVGHLPSLAELASFLLLENEKLSLRFEMGGLGRIDVPALPTHQGELRWYIVPDYFRLIAG